MMRATTPALALRLQLTRAAELVGHHPHGGAGRRLGRRPRLALGRPRLPPRLLRAAAVVQQLDPLARGAPGLLDRDMAALADGAPHRIAGPDPRSQHERHRAAGID